MYKAISVIRFKLEDEVIKKNPDFSMSDMTKLDKIDFSDMSWCGFKLNTDEFPTVNPDKPSELTAEEKEIIKELKRNFTSSEKMQKHLNFLFSKGSIYLCFNGNLLYHGCVPIYENGDFFSFSW